MDPPLQDARSCTGSTLFCCGRLSLLACQWQQLIQDSFCIQNDECHHLCKGQQLDRDSPTK